MDWSNALADPEALRARGLFLAEGRLVLSRILAGAAGGPDAIVAILATPAAAGALLLEPQFDDRLTIRTPAEMEALTGFNFHRGVLALVRRPAIVNVADLVGSSVGRSVEQQTARSRLRPGFGVQADSQPYLTHGVVKAEGRTPKADDGPRAPVLVVAEHLVDVDNVGSAFRNARAFGARCVLLDQRCPDPLYRKAVRTSLGHVLDVPWAQAPIEEILAALRERGVATIGLTPHDTATIAETHVRLTAHLPVAVVVGNEGSGLSAETMAGCTHLARIPMAGGADSLNVATALAVALYELTR